MKKKIKYAKRDFTKHDLPHTRYEVFTDILKVRFDIILKTGTVLFLSLLPLIIFSLAKNIYTFTLNDNLANEVIDQNLYNEAFFSVNIIFGFLQALSLTFFALGLSGVLNIFKRLCFYDSIQFKEDFFRGIKDNFKHSFITFAIVGLLYFLSIFYTLMNRSSDDFVTAFICYLPIVLGIILIVPIAIMVLFQIPIYENTLSQYIKNGIYFYGKTPFKTLGLLISLFIPFLPLFIDNIYSMIISTILVCFFVLPISILVLNLYCNSVFDEYLNKDNFKEIYKKGLN